MSELTMDMSSYEVKRDESCAEEVMCARWNTALALQLRATSRPSLPVGIPTIDVESFLNLMDTYSK